MNESLYVESPFAWHMCVKLMQRNESLWETDIFEENFFSC